jgi:hypothetical protein
MDNPEIALSVTKDTEQIQTKQKTQQRSLKILATQTPHNIKTSNIKTQIFLSRMNKC